MRARVTSCLALAALAAACGPGRERKDPVLPDAADIRVNVRSYAHPYELEIGQAGPGLVWLVVELDILQRNLPSLDVSFDAFSLETNAASYAALEGSGRIADGCGATAVALPSQTRYCKLVFRVTAGETPRTLYLATAAGTVSGSFERATPPPPMCAVASEELSVEQCSDGCNNDGDAFVDCNDADCCPVLVGCGADTYCGRHAPECVLGPEGSLSSCLDRCDNDGVAGADCNDMKCCDVLSCSADTVCGNVSDPFAGTFVVDDDAVRRVDPSTLLAGPAPCRAPTLVSVSFASDGDTVNVFSVDGGGVEGPVRLIGIDTPEIAHNGDPAECYGERAKETTRRIEGHLAWLTFDAECFDQYDRNLAYVHVGPSRTDLWQRQLIRRGMARVYTVRGNDALAELFEQDYAVASSEGVGMHSACP